MKSNGKNICHALKTIRKQVADANGIHYTPAPCRFDGDCRGTCPACEAEVQYIESQLGRLRLAGKAVKVAGLALGLTMVAGCNSSPGTPPPQRTSRQQPTKPHQQANPAHSRKQTPPYRPPMKGQNPTQGTIMCVETAGEL